MTPERVNAKNLLVRSCLNLPSLTNPTVVSIAGEEGLHNRGGSRSRIASPVSLRERRREVGWDKLKRSPTKMPRECRWDYAPLVPPYGFRNGSKSEGMRRQVGAEGRVCDCSGVADDCPDVSRRLESRLRGPSPFLVL